MPTTNTEIPVWKQQGYANVGAYNAAQNPTATVATTENPPITPIVDKTALETAIKSGNFTASQRSEYNKATGNQQGTRELALGSQPAVDKMQTSVTADEFKGMQDAGIKNSANMGKGITADLQGGTKEEFKQDVQAPTPIQEKTITETPEGTTTVTKETPTPTGITKDTSWNDVKDKNLTNLESLIEARYETIANQENGKLIAEVNGEKFEWSLDLAGNPIKKSLGKISDLQMAEQYKNPDNIYNTLLTGGTIPEQYKNTPEYQQANKRFTEYNKYKDFNDKQFQTAFTQGLILPGTQLYNDLSKDPKIKLSIDKANALNKVNGVKVNAQDVYNTQSDEIANNTNVTVNGQTMTLSKAMEDGFISPDEYNSMTNNSQVTSKAQEVEDLKNKTDELQNTYDNVRTEVENSLKGTGATKSDLESIVGEKQKNMLGNLNLSISKYNNALGTLTDMKKQATDLFATNLGLYQKAEERTYQEQQKTKELEQAYQYKYGDINSTNSTIQNVAIQNAVADMYTKYPIPGMESQSAKVQKVKDYMSGKTTGTPMTGAQAIASVEGEIRNSDKYKTYMANEKDKMTPQTKYGFTEMGGNLYKTDDKGNISLAIKGTPKSRDLKWTKLDDGMYQDPQGNIHTKQELDQAKLLNNNLLNAEIGTNVGMECGQYARTATGMSSTPGGNSLEERKKQFSDINPQPGGMVLFTGGGYDKTYGHIAVITSVSPDGQTFKVKESNYNTKNPNTVTERTLTRDQIKKAGVNVQFYNNTPLAGGGQDTQGLTDKQFTQFNQMYSKFAGDPQVKAFESALAGGGDLIASLKSSNGPGDVGAVFGFMKSLDPASVVKEGEFALAAKSAGVWESFKNIPANKLEGTILTEEQRKDFGKLAFEYIKSKGKLYDVKYNDMAKILKNQNIPDSYMPTKMTDYINQFDGSTPAKTPVPPAVKVNNPAVNTYLQSIGINF